MPLSVLCKGPVHPDRTAHDSAAGHSKSKLHSPTAETKKSLNNCHRGLLLSHPTKSSEHIMIITFKYAIVIKCGDFKEWWRLLYLVSRLFTEVCEV